MMGIKYFFATGLICFILSQGFSQARIFSFENVKRKFLIYLPENYGQQKERDFPLVLNFHGGGMTMTEQMFYSGMNATV